MSEPESLTVEILRQIRDEIVATRTDLGARIEQTNARLDATRTELAGRIDQTNVRLHAVEHTLLELSEQQRFVVRHLEALTARDRTLERDVDELRTRVDAIEKRLDR